jgi:shikimate dehydrogenase
VSSVPREIVGVVGRPIGHSLSPLLHAAAFDALGLPWMSTRFDAGRGQGAEIVSSMRALGVRGLSVTMPLKAEMASLADRLDEQARLLESVNCLSVEDGIVVGYSTDGGGLLDAIAHGSGRSVEDARVLVAGSGGAARSVVAAIGAAGALEVSVVARRDEAARSVAALAGSVGRAGDPTDASLADIVIDATPVGMAGTPQTKELPLIDPALLHDGQLAIDLVYEPRETPWLDAARRNGASTMGGLGMLVHQAARQISIWTGESAPVAAMWRAAESVVGR